MKLLSSHLHSFLSHPCSKKAVLIRHGQSISNQGGTLSGWTDSHLTIKGREQANSLYEPLHGFVGRYTGEG